MDLSGDYLVSLLAFTEASSNDDQKSARAYYKKWMLVFVLCAIK